MRAGRRHGGRQNATDLRSRLQQACVVVAAVVDACADRVGDRSVSHLQGCKQTGASMIEGSLIICVCVCWLIRCWNDPGRWSTVLTCRSVCGTPLAITKKIGALRTDARMWCCCVSPSPIRYRCGTVAQCGTLRSDAFAQTLRCCWLAARTTCGICIVMRLTYRTLAIGVRLLGRRELTRNVY